jgi:predicted CXXCH cytochrome family protein
LFDGNLGCGSCHSAYSKEPHLLVMNNRGSKLCLSCHTQ